MKRTTRPQVAESLTGTPWSITDLALHTIDAELAIPVPERGAALIAARDSRVISDVIVDPRPGQRVSYWHSDQLRIRLADYLAGNTAHRYVGTVHSHPGGFAEPSGPDHDAFANMLRTNPGVRDAIFPIVVQERRDALGAVRRLGDQHLIDLPHGTFAGYSAHPGDGGLSVRPAPMHVIPIGAHGDAVAATLSERIGVPVAATSGKPVTLNGTSWLTVNFIAGGRTVAGAALGPSYPATPPMVWTAASSSPTFPVWPAGAGGTDLAQAITDLLPVAVSSEPVPAPGRDCAPADAPVVVDQPAAPVIRAGIEARLQVHLPHRIDTHVLLIGAGSVGSTAAEMLVRSGVRRLTVVDFDTVEPANLSRTVYRAMDVGRPKTVALADRLTAIAPDLTLALIDTPLQELGATVLDSVDLAFLASDDLAGEGWLNHELYLRGIPFVSVKVFAGAAGTELAYVVPQRNTACLRCMMGALGGGDRGEVNYGTGRINGSPALGPDILAAAARGVKVALALTQPSGPLAEWAATLLDRRLTYFLSSNVPGWKYTEHMHPGSLPFDGVWLTAPGRADCPICGSDRAVWTQPAAVAAFSADPPPDDAVQGISDLDTTASTPEMESTSC